AVTALAGMGDQRAIEPLATSLGDRNAEVRLAAIESLMRVGDTGVREQLIRCLKEEKAWRVRYKLVKLFAEYSFPDIVDALIETLGDDDDVRAYAAVSLGIIGDSRALPALEYMAANDEGEYWSEEKESYMRTRSAAEGAIETIRAIETGEEVERSSLAVQSRSRVRHRMKDYSGCQKTFIHYGRITYDDVFPGPNEPNGLVDRIELRFNSRKNPYRPHLGTITVDWYAPLRAYGVVEDAMPEMRIPWDAWGALAECGDLLTQLGHASGPAMQPDEFAELLRQDGFADITR
ncbi:MAG: HEAT repeat domain-containing protein, partial [Ktedonobacterales bacterium]